MQDSLTSTANWILVVGGIALTLINFLAIWVLLDFLGYYPLGQPFKVDLPGKLFVIPAVLMSIFEYAVVSVWWENKK